MNPMTEEQLSHHKDNWSAAGMVGMFDSVLLERQGVQPVRAAGTGCM